MNNGTMRFVPVLLALLFAPAMHATTIYTYVGNPFTSVTGTFTTSMRLTGSFTLNAPLADNLAGVQITPTDYSFFDGIETDSSSQPVSSMFFVSTNATGAIVAWAIQTGGLAGISSCSNSVSPLPMLCGSATIDAVATPHGIASVEGSPGTWTVTQVPERSTFTLLFGAMVCVGIMKLSKSLAQN